MLRKCNKILSFLLALALVITTFGSDFANAKVFAVEEENIVEETTDNTEEVLPEIFEEVNEPEDPEVENTEIEENAEVEEAAPAEAAVDEETAKATVTEEVETAEEVETPASEENVEAAETVEVTETEEEVTEETADLTGLTEEEKAKAKALKLLEEETEESEEEEVEVEEKEFAASTEIDNLVISLYADPGVLPADAELRVEKVGYAQEEEIKELIDDELGEEKEVTETFSYDINIYSPSADGYVQPEDGTVEVRFEEVAAAEDDSLELSVFHVDDSISDATEVASAGSEATDISFDAEHFSIYSVTIYRWVDRNGNGHGDVEFNAGVYKYNEETGEAEPLDTENSVRKVVVNAVDLDRYVYVSAADTAPVIFGYAFDVAKVDGKEIASFYKNNTNAYARLKDSDDYVEISATADEAVQFFYRVVESTEYETKNHIDLGFTNAEMPEVAKAEISFGDGWHDMNNKPVDEPDLAVQEKRYIPDRTISASEIITFRVTLKNGSQYEHTTTEAENRNAYERCKNAHTYCQNKFGFDFKFDFVKDFGYGATVYYHSNFENDVVEDDIVEWTSQQEDQPSEYTILAYDDEKINLPANTDGSTFLGWDENPDVETPTYAFSDGVFNPATISINNGDTLNLYAIWKNSVKYDVKFYLYNDKTGKFEFLEKQEVKEGEFATEPELNKEDSTFKGWYDNKGMTGDEYDFTTPVTKSFNLYAKLIKNIEEISYFILIGDLVDPIEGLQERVYYYPENSNPVWKGTAKNIDLLDQSKLWIQNRGDYIYKARFSYPDGLDQEEIGYTIQETAITGINNYLNRFNVGLDADSPDRITYDDVVWYVYKRQKLNTHIDGYVSAHITYIANGGGTTPDGRTTVATDKKMLGSTVTIRDNMFTVTGNNEFRGWNTAADGSGQWYYPDTPEFALNRNLTLYAQWGVKKNFTVNFYYQNENGVYPATPNKVFTQGVVVPVDPSETVTVTGVVDETTDPLADLAPRYKDEEKSVSYAKKFVSEKVAYTYDKTVNSPLVIRNDNAEYIIDVYYNRDDFDATLKITALSTSFYYDGKAHDYPQYSVDSVADGFSVDDVTVEINNENKSVTNVADSPAANVKNNIVKQIKLKNNESGVVYTIDVNPDGSISNTSPFYGKVVVINGRVDVRPRPLEIKVGYAEKKFDGDYFHADQYGKNADKTLGRETITYTVKYLPDEADIDLTLDDVLVNIPKDVITVEQSKISNEEINILGDRLKVLIDNKSVSKDNFIITIKKGDLKITPVDNKWRIKVSIKADAEGDGNKKVVVYNGVTQSVITNLKLTVADREGNEIIYDDSIVPAEDDGRTNIAEYLLSLLQKIRGFMVLTVHASDEWQELPAQTITHDGKNYTVSGLKIKGGEGVDVDTYPVTLNYDDMDITLDGVSVKSSLAENQHGDEIIGSLQIIERNVYLSSESASKVYDGTPLTRPVVAVDVDEANNKYDFVAGEVVDLRAAGSITEVGSVENRITYTKVANKYKDRNYIVHTTEGTLTITGTGGDNPPSDPDTPPTNPDTPPSDPGTPTTVTPPSGQQVLGAVRSVATGDGAAVLGARRGRTEDTTNTLGRIITIIVAAGIGFMMIFIKRKKNEE